MNWSALSAAGLFMLPGAATPASHKIGGSIQPGHNSILRRLPMVAAMLASIGNATSTGSVESRSAASATNVPTGSGSNSTGKGSHSRHSAGPLADAAATAATAASISPSSARGSAATVAATVAASMVRRRPAARMISGACRSTPFAYPSRLLLDALTRSVKSTISGSTPSAAGSMARARANRRTSAYVGASRAAASLIATSNSGPAWIVSAAGSTSATASRHRGGASVSNSRSPAR